MDGLSGLEKVFEEEFSQAKVHRCQVHVARNVLTKAPLLATTGTGTILTMTSPLKL
jgi:transposase-like protein